MIDWVASNISQTTVKNKDKIIVVCERCNISRSQLYIVAKRKAIHHCLSCVKSAGGPFKTGQMVEHKCLNCSVVRVQKYRPDRFIGWLCHHCAMVQGHKEGKFTIMPNKPSKAGCEKLAQLAKDRWNNREYREKWKTTRNSTKATRSKFSKELWSDQDRLTKLSNSLKTLWKNEEYRVKQKAGYTDVVKETMALKRSQQPSISSIQLQLYQYLDDLGVSYHKEGPETTKGYFVFDCLVPRIDGIHKNLLIECQGDYWYSLARTQQNDRSKFTYIDRYFPNYEIMYIWEHEFYAKDRVLDRLKAKLGLLINGVDFEFAKVELKIPTPIELKKFLDAYHYIGKGRGGKVVGAYLNGELIGCVVFSSPLRQNLGNITELSRLCIHPSYHKKNFASWLVSKALKSVSGVIVAYADRTVGHVGTVYKACGFKLDHVVPADYWYVDEDGYVMHKKTLYNQAVRLKMTEAGFADKNNYMKVFGGQKFCYTKTI